MLKTVDERPIRILVVRALQLGDLLCAIPALRALRTHYPNAHITLCGLPWSQELVTRIPQYLDDFVTFPGCEGIPEKQPIDLEALDELRANAESRPWDLIVQLHGSGHYINEFVRSIRSRATLGFHPSSQPEIGLDSSLEWPEVGHEIERLKALVLHLGAADCGDRLEFPVFEFEQVLACQLLYENGVDLSKPYICVHAGGRSLTRRWLAERYKAVVDRLTDDGWQVVLTGVAAELDIAAALTQVALSHAASPRCTNLFGKTNTGTLAAILEGARLMISNDTGVSHIAAALGIPSVVLVLGSDPARWFPQNRELHHAVSVPVDCRPCSYTQCPIGFPCATGLTTDAVYVAIQDALVRTESQCMATA